MSDLTESFYQRLPAGGEMLRREKRKRNEFLEEMGIGGGGGGDCGDERLDVYIRTNHRPAGTGTRRGLLEWERQIKTSAPVDSRRHDEDK